MGNTQKQQPPQQQPPQQQPQVNAPATAQNADAEKQATLMRALAGVTSEWKKLCGSLCSDVIDPQSPPDPSSFRKEAYAALAKRDGSGLAGLPAVKQILSQTDSRKKYYADLEIVEADIKADGIRRAAIHGHIKDIIAGSDAGFCADRIIAEYLMTSTNGREWWKSADAEEWVGALAAYSKNTELLGEHCADLPFYMRPPAAIKRAAVILPVLNLFKTGHVSGKAPDPKKDEPIAGPSDAQKKEWDKQAADLKKEIEPHLPEDGAVGKEVKKIDSKVRAELIQKVSAAPIEVRDRLFADTAFMRRVAMLGEQTTV